MFRSTVGQWFGYGWLVFAAFNLGDLAWRGNDRTALVLAAVLLAATGLVHVTALRPRIIADSAGLRIVNPLRDMSVAWAAVTSVDAADAILVRTDAGRYRCWAVHAPNRHRTRAHRARTRAAAGAAPTDPRRTTSIGPGSDVRAGAEGRTRADYVAAQLDEMARSGRRTAPGDRAESRTWSRSSLAVLASGAALVLASLIVPY